MTKVTIELEFDRPPTTLEIYEYLYDLLDSDDLDYEVEGELADA